MHAKREGEFASMMEIVLNEMPDHLLACIGLIFSILIDKEGEEKSVVQP